MMIMNRPNMRNARRVMLVEVLEGKGTKEDVYELVSYIINDDGIILGRVEQKWDEREPLPLTPVN